MNGGNSYKTIGIITLLLLVVCGGYYLLRNPEVIGDNNGVSTTTPETISDSVKYSSSQYGFVISLPKSWEGYSIIETEWVGDSVDANGNFVAGTVKGPLISVRHPEWSSTTPRQDIPIMIFTIKQWNDMQADKFHIGAAPINPSEMNRSENYVYGLPARYNFSYLEGYEEVAKILEEDPLEPISPE